MGLRDVFKRQSRRERELAGHSSRLSGDPSWLTAHGSSPSDQDQLREAIDLLQRTDPAHLREVVTEDWFWGRVGIVGSDEDYFWRRLSDNWTQKDVLPGTYLEIHNQCYEAYNANPMANAIVEMGVNFTLGDGLTIDCRSRKVQKIIDAFWSDPDNRMDLRQYSLATELSLYGELFIRFFVNPYSGHVKIAQIDPSLIDEIECDPENIEKELRVHRRALGPKANAPYTQTATAPVSDVVVPAQWFSVPDEVMHFAINKVTNAKRGKSDLATLLPWLRRYKDWLIDRVRINKYKAAFLWDVTLNGADRKAIDQKAMEYSRPPEPGSINIHNESEIWQAVQPNIDAGDVEADGHAMKMMVAMGAGLPEHFLSEGGDVNRATAAEMGLPTLKKYQRRQDYLKYLLSHILDRVLDEARAAGKIQAGTDTSYEIRFPELHTEDSQAIGSASWHMAQALQIVSPMGFLSRETAQQLFFSAARAEIDANEEWDRLVREMSGEGPIGNLPPMMVASQLAAAAAHPPPAGSPSSRTREASTSPSPFRPVPRPSPSVSGSAAGHRRSDDEEAG